MWKMVKLLSVRILRQQRSGLLKNPQAAQYCVKNRLTMLRTRDRRKSPSVGEMCQCRGGQDGRERPHILACTLRLLPGACYFLSGTARRFFPALVISVRDCVPCLPGAGNFLPGIACAPQEVPLGCTRLRLFQQPASDLASDFIRSN